MKYSFMSFSCPQLELKELLQTAKKYGYDGIEPRIDANHGHKIEPGAAGLREAKKLADDMGIAFSCIATSCMVADLDMAESTLEKLKKAIELAEAMGAPTIRIFGGDFTTTRKTAIETAVNTLLKVAEPAKSANVTVCLETHDSWCNPSDIAKIITAVNHENIAVNWDIMHPIIRTGQTMTEVFEILKPWIRHVHVHDGLLNGEGNLEFCPIGQGSVDHKTAVELLSETGYSGFISGEWINWESPEIHLPRELKMLKSFE